MKIYPEERGVSEAIGGVVIAVVLLTVLALLTPILGSSGTRGAEAEYMKSVKESFLDIQEMVDLMSDGDSASLEIQMSSSPPFYAGGLERSGFISAGKDENKLNCLEYVAKGWYHPSRSFLFEGGAVIENHEGRVYMSSKPKMVKTRSLADDNIMVEVEYIKLMGNFRLASKRSRRLELTCKSLRYENAPLGGPNSDNVVVNLEGKLQYTRSSSNLLRNSSFTFGPEDWRKRVQAYAVGGWEDNGGPAWGCVFGRLRFYSLRRDLRENFVQWFQEFAYGDAVPPVENIKLSFSYQVGVVGSGLNVDVQVVLENTDRLDTVIYHRNHTSSFAWERFENDITRFITRPGIYKIKLWCRNMRAGTSGSEVKVCWDEVYVIHKAQTDYWRVWRDYLKEVRDELNRMGHNADLTDNKLELIIHGKRGPGVRDIFYFEKHKEVEVRVNVV